MHTTLFYVHTHTHTRQDTSCAAFLSAAAFASRSFCSFSRLASCVCVCVCVCPFLLHKYISFMKNRLIVSHVVMSKAMFCHRKSVLKKMFSGLCFITKWRQIYKGREDMRSTAMGKHDPMLFFVSKMNNMEPCLLFLIEKNQIF